MDTPISPQPVQSQAMPKLPIDLDPRTITTMKWSAVWNAVGHAIQNVAGYLSLYFIGGVAGDLVRAFGGSFVGQFPAGELVRDALLGAIYGAVFGFVISKFYPVVQQLNRQYLKGWLNTFFKLMFYPSLVFSLIAIFPLLKNLGFGLGYGMSFMPLIVIIAGGIVSSFIYAKMMTKYVSSLYSPPL